MIFLFTRFLCVKYIIEFYSVKLTSLKLYFFFYPPSHNLFQEFTQSFFPFSHVLLSSPCFSTATTIMLDTEMNDCTSFNELHSLKRDLLKGKRGESSHKTDKYNLVNIWEIGRSCLLVVWRGVSGRVPQRSGTYRNPEVAWITKELCSQNTENILKRR